MEIIRINIENDRLRDGIFPKSKLEDLGVKVEITSKSFCKEEIKLTLELSKDEEILPTVLSLGKLIQQFQFSN